MKYNFDLKCDRSNTNCVKWDSVKESSAAKMLSRCGLRIWIFRPLNPSSPP